MPLSPLKESGDKPTFGGHGPSGLGQYGQYPPDEDTDLYYLVPLSYGIPSAFGAREFFDVNASTISEMM